jgi:predicted ribosomally synthesized peptide with SipW-like signal peptide
MTDKHPLELSRRKILAGLGSIGVASAGVGLGTSAYFSDTETFTNNELVAGQLDMKVSWEEHYSDWSEDEAEFASMPGPEQEPDLSLSAPPGGKPIELVVSDWDGFMGTTLQEQFPEGGLEAGEDPCEALADVPDDLEAPVIELEDVKPGDFGEVTFDFSLCDNPGYVWMNGELVSEAENGLTEPESKDPDENDVAGSSADTEGDEVQIATNGSLGATSLEDPGLDAEMLANSLVSDQSDVEVVPGSVNFVGDPRGGGMFTGGGSAVGIEDGVILSSGKVVDVEGPNDLENTTTDLGTPGDPDLDTLTTENTFNASILEFDFTVPDDADKVYFNYVFGSEEYNEFVGSTFNDVFGFFVNGQNVALVDDPSGPGTLPAAINNINNGQPGIQPTNPDLYVNNDPFDPDSTGNTVPSDQLADTEMDGFTVVLDVEADVDPGETNSMKLAIADTADAVLDSWVLIESGSITTEPEEEGGESELPDALRARLWYDDGDNIRQDDEEVFLEGSLREVLTALSNGNGVPLDGDQGDDFDEMGDPTADTRGCYTAADDVHYVGFQWWLPIDHGNEVQTDSVTFDLGFYTEQCRHNDGEGMPTTASVTFEDQDSDGTSVVVDSATLPSGGYVVIHESDNGAPGPVLGHSSYLPAVTSTDVTVQLDSPISESQELIAMAHMDDGDQQYEFPDADGPYTVNGAPVIDAAQITIPDGG